MKTAKEWAEQAKIDYQHFYNDEVLIREVQQDALEAAIKVCNKHLNDFKDASYFRHNTEIRRCIYLIKELIPNEDSK